MDSPLLHVPNANKRNELQAYDKTVKSRVKLSYFFYCRREGIYKTHHHHYPADDAYNTNNAGAFCFYSYHAIYSICGTDSLYRVEL